MITDKISKFLKEVKTEVKKVNWPTRKEIIKHTLTVVGFSLVVALFLGLLDFILVSILERFFI